MESTDALPSVGSRAFSKDTSAYVEFPTQSDALLASLQLFHDVPCRVMDLIFSILAHPDFDPSQLTLRRSADISRAEEEARRRDRMVAAHNRSRNSEGVAVQAGLPQFVLEHVLDTIEAEKVARIRARMERDLSEDEMRAECFRAEEDAVLSDMSLVHRSWTLPAQKALGRSLYISRPLHRLDLLYNRAILGPWTSLIALDLFHQVVYEDDDYGCGDYDGGSDGFCLTFSSSRDTEDLSLADQIREKYGQWLDSVDALLGSFDSLKCLLIRSHHSVFTQWAHRSIETLVSQNPGLEAITLYALDGSFKLDPLLESDSISRTLRSLSMQGVTASIGAQACHEQTGSFAGLRSLRIKLSSFDDDFEVLSILADQSDVHLETLALVLPVNPYIWRSHAEELSIVLSPRQCTSLFRPLRTLHIDLGWLGWIRPYCPDLETLAITISADDIVSLPHLVPASIQNLDLILNSALNAKEWTQRLLLLPTNNHFTALRRLRLEIAHPLPASDKWVFDPGNKVEAIQTFGRKMQSVCRDAGIVFRFDYTVDTER